ncbi:MAG: hypothetical protein IIA07_09540 [Proteobacteria bacterium]|nr:hypothetical protein [Pseudomonadota bacterium]
MIIGLGTLSACAPTHPIERRPEIDMSVIREMLDCPINRTPVCTEYMGKPAQCFCADRDALKEILDPDDHRRR